MKVFLDKEFLQKFEVGFDDINQIDSILKDLFTAYPELELYINIKIEQIEDVEKLKNESKILNQYFSNNTNGLNTIEDNDIEKSILDFSLFFISSIESKSWYKEAQEHGILCFTIDNYRNEIASIIDKYHYRIDLSENEFYWDKLRFVKSREKITITDNYVLSDKSNQKISENIIPLLKEIASNIRNRLNVRIFTIAQESRDDINHAEKILDRKITSIKETLNQCLLYIFNTTRYTYFDFHDRLILTEYQLVECGKGFNLIPHKPSNSQISSFTIFDKCTYKRMKNLARAILNCENHLNKPNAFYITKYPLE